MAVTLTRFLVVALLSLESCGSSSLAGTYVATGTGQYRLAGGGDTATFSIPDDTFVVSETARHYQYYEYSLSVRGCSVRAEGDAKSASTRGGDSTCTFDIPSVGRVSVQVSGGVSREPDARAHLSLSGTSRDSKLESFGYSIHGKPR